MDLADYSAESLTFSGLGAEGATPAAAAAAMAEELNNWAATHAGQRLLQLHTVALPAAGGSGLAAVLIHTAGSELSGELAEQVAAAVEEAIGDGELAPAFDSLSQDQ